ncbi:hypothetical protein OG596_32580 [Streptomyces sp. NBC_01102]|uniref:hypothetical protein n=1 Tax=unclassified Streptomyces TaxID=2593676 RepID=UPI00386B8C34|nr:hypothetical protein OG596_32580 [Streptomyces sp. NBC_01102]
MMPGSVAVVGGGPLASSVAAALSRRGVDVQLLPEDPAGADLAVLLQALDGVSAPAAGIREQSGKQLLHLLERGHDGHAAVFGRDGGQAGGVR